MSLLLLLHEGYPQSAAGVVAGVGNVTANCMLLAPQDWYDNLGQPQLRNDALAGVNIAASFFNVNSTGLRNIILVLHHA